VGQTEIGLIGIGALVVLLMMGVHIGFALILVGFIGFSAIGGINGAIHNLAILPFDKLNNYHFAVLPLFLLMGSFVAHSGIGREAYQFARAWMGQLRGGLAMATVGASALIAACAGTSAVGAILMGQVAYPEMKKLGYSKNMASGLIAAGGTMGILIPPSMGFVLIGILTELSIGKLFIAGIIPGILEATFYIITIFLLCKFNPSLAPASINVSWKEKWGSVRLTWPVVILFLLIMGGIYGGVFTPTEAGGIGAFGALVISMAKRQLGMQGLWDSLMECGMTTAMIILMLIGAYMFNTFDVIAVLVLTIPIMYPLMEALGFNLIWYSVLMVRIIEIGMITPPFGINLFILTGVINEPLRVLYRGIIPFVISDFCHVALLIAVPSLCTVLPNMMM